MLGIVQNTLPVFSHLTPTASYEFGDFIFPITEVGKLKLRENKHLAHDFSANEQQSRGLNPHLLALESTLLTIMLSRDNFPASGRACSVDSLCGHTTWVTVWAYNLGDSRGLGLRRTRTRFSALLSPS